MDNKYFKIMQELGLSANEAVIYRSLLHVPHTSVRSLAHTSGINRGLVYEALKSLVTKGLVGTVRKGARSVYIAESPDKITKLLQDRRKTLWEVQRYATDVVPALMANNPTDKGQPLVKYFEDDKGIVAILDDVLQTCRALDVPIYHAYSSKPIRQYLYRRYPTFTKRRIDEGIEVKVIALGDGGEYAARSERRWVEAPTAGQMSSYIIIYGPKVAHIAISANDTPYGVIIEDESVASMQRLLFERMWQQL
jgi:sugar-specific transcriptional regulator TrmB